MWLTSPYGTRSRLLRPRRFDTFNGTMAFTFMTVMSWGELSRGEWTLQLETTDISNSNRLSYLFIYICISHKNVRQSLPEILNFAIFKGV